MYHGEVKRRFTGAGGADSERMNILKVWKSPHHDQRCRLKNSESILLEDDLNSLMWYDQGMTRTGGGS